MIQDEDVLERQRRYGHAHSQVPLIAVLCCSTSFVYHAKLDCQLIESVPCGQSLSNGVQTLGFASIGTCKQASI